MADKVIKEPKPSKITWACPQCAAVPNKHGKGGDEDCVERMHNNCSGFLCECDIDRRGHGNSHEDPCLEAICYHCGWRGTFPVPLYNPKKLTGWAKQAYKAGWRPPEGWTP